MKNFKIIMTKKPSTDLDTLYDLLREKKELKIEDISKKFNVNEDLVMSWAKILEAGDLAIINNPRIGKPSIIIVERESEEETKKSEKPKLKKQEKKTIERANKSIKEENREKIKAAKDLIRQLKEMGHDNNAIKKLFTEKGWPEDLVNDLIKHTSG